jgi:acetyl esterase/lipase
MSPIAVLRDLSNPIGRAGVALTMGFMLASLALADEPTVKTFTYKTLDAPANVLEADVHLPTGDKVPPVVIFIHGGALMMGGRKLTPKPGSLLEALLRADYAVVSIDYRLAPQVKLPAIIEDLRDACAWVRTRGPELFHIDPENLFVMGQSAGGYLTQMSGFWVNPRPRALVSFWGYGDITGPWYSRPDPFYCRQPMVTKAEADNPASGKLYLYCRQQGLWPKVLTGHDPDQEPRYFDPFCPVRNVTAQYPPTLLIHGTKDTDVPYQLSEQMEKELAARGVEHQFITIPDGGHGFDQRNQDLAVRTYQKVVEFLQKHRK